MDAAVAEAIEACTGSRILGTSGVTGGDVASAYRVRLADGRVVFAKTKADAKPAFFETEATGLSWLAEPDVLPVPRVLGVSARPPVLVLEWIEAGNPTGRTEADFGAVLAALHRAGAPHFGRADRASTGSLELPNQPYDTWGEALAANRLLPLARIGVDRSAYSHRVGRSLERVAAQVEDLVPSEPPARLHGDLWAGNRMIGAGGISWLIDPAAHGGHREYDLAMMELFGGFGPRCFEAYHDVFPLADGWRSRIPLHQLAPLAVHAIKFGGGYVGALQRALTAC